MNTIYRKYAGAAAIAALAFYCTLALYACTPRPKEIVFAGAIMGTEYHAKCVDTSRSLDQDTLHNAVLSALREVDALMSTYKPDSELSRLNAHGDDSPFPLSAATLSVFKTALQLSEMTGGAFDITVGPLVNAHGFGPEVKSAPPDAQTLAEIREYVGFELLELDSEAGAIRKKHPKVYCDLSAVAKGYAVDQAAEALEKLGVANFMVEVGGEVRVNGRNLEGKPWRIAIELPDAEQRAIHRVVPLEAAGATPLRAMATSGDYRNFYTADGKRVSHTFDPRTGQTVAHDLASVTVLHNSCAWADALATALMVLGPEEGLDFAEKNGIAAYMLLRTPDGGFAPRHSTHFPIQHP